jgi:exocyst complex component 2
MARDVVGLYIRLLSSFFTLSSPSASPSESSTSGKPPAFVPRDSNSLTAGIWSNRILTEIVEAGNELSLGDIGSEAMDEWQGLIDSTRWRTVEVICETWRLGESLALLRNLKMDRLLTSVALCMIHRLGAVLST